jgi:DNA-binding response OmpR family regulator
MIELSFQNLKLGIDDYLLKPMVYDEARFRLKNR